MLKMRKLTNLHLKLIYKNNINLLYYNITDVEIFKLKYVKLFQSYRYPI